MDLPDRFNATTFFVDRHVAEGRGGHAAFRVAGGSISYADLASMADRLGNGHLLIKGPTTSAYYWHRRERTRQVMRGEWIRTGDLLSQDGDGYFYFAGRADDMVKVGGQWVSPNEVEARLTEHRAVLEAAVVGREDAQGLMTLCAFVVPKAGQSVDEAELKTWVKSGLAGYKVPHRFEVVTDLPKTATGKVQRFRLRYPPWHAHCP
jgi:benzoate-CoA ligase